MHPVIRLIGFMVLGAGLMVGGVKEVAVLALLAAALCWLAKPLNIFSGAGDRFAVRAVLTLETVTHARHIFREPLIKSEVPAAQGRAAQLRAGKPGKACPGLASGAGSESAASAAMFNGVKPLNMKESAPVYYQGHIFHFSCSEKSRMDLFRASLGQERLKEERSSRWRRITDTASTLFQTAVARPSP